jgi:AcrR family transcriptional regulator
MPRAVKPRRPYRSPRRQEQAQQTRQRIIDAAYALFAERGYGGTTIVAVAQQAGTAAETIYAVFENKPKLLSDVVLHALRGGEEGDVPVIEQAGPQAIIAMDDQRAQITGLAKDLAARYERYQPLVEVLAGAARSVPELAELNAGLRETRRESFAVFVDALRRNGPLRVERARAVDTVLALASPEVNGLLTEFRGWSRKRYADWLDDTLTATLLPGDAD